MTFLSTITFVDKGSVATTARDVVYVGVGQHLMPGVLDHKATDAHLRGFRGVTDIVIKEPALYREHLARTRAEDLLILTNNDPDLDTALACYLICHWKAGRDRLDEAAVSAARRYVADAKQLKIDVRPGAEALEDELLVVFEAIKHLADEQHAESRGRRHAQRAGLDRAFSVFDWLLTRPPARELLREAPGLDDVRKTIRDDRDRYACDQEGGRKLSIPLLRKGVRETVVADVLAVEGAKSFLFALWAYYDFANSPRGHGFAVAIQSRSADHAVEVTVSPHSVVHLRGLGSRLEQREKEARRALDRDRLGPPRPGYDTADPWFDGRGTLHEDRLVAAPGTGTVLTFGQILDELTEYAKFSPAEIEASVDEVQGLEHFPEAEQAANRALLRKLFLGKDGPKLDDRGLRVVRRFGEGQSGAHVLEVDAAVGPGVRRLQVVKLGPRGLIEQEWRRWQAVQAHTGGGRSWATPIVAFREDGDRAGLIYAHARAWGGGAPTSLKQFALEALASPDRHARLREVILQLFDQVEGVFHAPLPAVAPPAAFYDQRLVPNLVLDVTDVDVVEVEPTMPLRELLESTHDEVRAPEPGTTLVVGGLEVLSDEGTGKVRCRGEGRLGGKVDLRSNGHALPHQPGESVRPLRARVVSTRAAQLAELAAAACAPIGGLHALLGERLTSPLAQVPALLRLPSDFYPHAMSHGDLNTENVLLLGHLSSPMLIDWASTGPDQPLVFDFVKLEVELRTHVFAPFHERGELDVATWRELELRLAHELGAGTTIKPSVKDSPLHARAAEVIATIRDRALARVPDVRRPDLGHEYLRGVALYALSTLKFKVSAAGKRLALLAAAAAAHELLGESGKGDVVRVSTSAFGIAKLVVDGTPRYLVQWNAKWKAFNVIAGHVEHELDQGFFDRGMLREAREELPTLPADRIYVRPLPIDLIETTRRSAGYDGLTRYVLRVFQLVFDLDRAEVLARTGERPENAWITEEELRCGRTTDGRDVTRFPIAEILDALPGGGLGGLAESAPLTG